MSLCEDYTCFGIVNKIQFYSILNKTYLDVKPYCMGWLL